MQASVPAIWLRSFFGFSPEEDGYIGWSQEVRRDVEDIAHFALEDAVPRVLGDVQN